MSTLVRKSTHCLICKSKKLVRFLSFGPLPLANSYLTKAELRKPELKVPLDVYFCKNCHLVQLLDIVDRSSLFSHYAYFSSASSTLVGHFEEYAKDLSYKYPDLIKQLVIDIGCNDGVLLKPLKKMGARVLGIDPAKNITSQLTKMKIASITDFFGTRIVSQIKNQYGQAGIITANNVLAHTDKIHDIIAGAKQILSPEGIFVFEVQYVASLLQKNQFDSLYHEHICYYSLSPLLYLLDLYGLQIVDCVQVDNHGGSLRLYAGHKSGPHRIKKSIQHLKQKEKTLKLYKIQTYREFAKQPQKVKKALTKMLTVIKKQGGKIAGYGAPAKATTLLNFCNIGNRYIDYITDTTPAKQNLFMPGNHIPIAKPSMLKKKTPDYILILAWNYTATILKQEQWFKRGGGKFVVPLPLPRII